MNNTIYSKQAPCQAGGQGGNLHTWEFAYMESPESSGTICLRLTWLLSSLAAVLGLPPHLC